MIRVTTAAGATTRATTTTTTRATTRTATTTGEHGDRDDDGEDCGTEALTTGRKVEEADLKLADGKATFEEIELK